MVAILIPIAVSALGYVVYELVKMGMEEFKEYAKGGGGCPEGTVFYILGEDQKLHCFDYDPKVPGVECPLPSVFDGVGPDGKSLCYCPPPNKLTLDGRCLPPYEYSIWQQQEMNRYAAMCPENTTFGGFRADGSVQCWCEEPNQLDANGNCFPPPPPPITATVPYTPVVQPQAPPPDPTPPPLPPKIRATSRPVSRMDQCIASLIAQGFSEAQAQAYCTNLLVPKESFPAPFPPLPPSPDIYSPDIYYYPIKERSIPLTYPERSRH